MLTLKNVVKVYGEGESAVTALKGISLNFRENEFVSVLGPSGCGKTTMLNILGGLDRYTRGDLIINGKSTEDFTDRDWDNYRNHSVGFVFQSYNLIPHQTVLSNVELALTLSGVSREERYTRAMEALKRVGLEGQAKKKPNQLSGGQMQRVAIARAIVNNPDIILADEPTGALDSETSTQVMDILKELSASCLVVMVTHNEDLAKTYSTRIINLFDGEVTSDTYPCTDDEAAEAVKKLDEAAKVDDKSSDKAAEGKKNRKKKASMSLLTAFSLSTNNLLTKKARTLLTSFAGSIGIIGIALILSVSTGFNTYIQNVQRDTLSNYPITISSSGIDYSTAAMTLMSSMLSSDDRDGRDEYPSDGKASAQNAIYDMVMNFAGSYETNDLTDFADYLKNYTEENDCSDIISSITYTYDYDMQIYNSVAEDDGTYRQLYPLSVPDMDDVLDYDLSAENSTKLNSYYKTFTNLLKSQDTFSQMIDNTELISEQYDVLAGKMATGENEAVIVVDSYNQITDLSLYSIGLMNDDDIRWIFYKMMLSLFNTTMTDEEIEEKLGCKRSDIYYNGIDIKDLLGLTFKVTDQTDKYKKQTGENSTVTDYEDSTKTASLWESKTDAEFQQYIADDAREVKIVGVLRVKKGVSAGCLTSTVCYTPACGEAVKTKILSSEIVTDYLKGVRADETEYYNILYPDASGGVYTSKTYSKDSSNYSAIGSKIGYFDGDTPTSILIYPKSFESKDSVIKIIDDYNAASADEDQISYTDYMGLMMDSITTIINAVTYVLIAFVSISLIVSSIMIGVITYISVLERTKEIGVLRSIGASKRDISRVFNAETFVIGLVSGVLGIVLTLLLNIPINIILKSLAGLTDMAVLPLSGALALIAISVVLTVIAGLVPSRIAAKRDPVIALRSE